MEEYMRKANLMDLIYDKLANNYEMDMFEPSMADDMCCVRDTKSNEPMIAMVINNREYVLSIKENTGNDFEVYQPTYKDIEVK